MYKKQLIFKYKCLLKFKKLLQNLLYDDLEGLTAKLMSHHGCVN